MKKTAQPVREVRQTASAVEPTRLAEIFSRPLIICLLLAVSTLAIYWPARTFDFLGYDDPLYYTQNAHVQGGLSASNVAWAFTTGDAANWHPLTWLSLMLDAELFGNQSAGPHLVNLVLHAANTILVFVLLRRLTAAHWPSALVAALFGLHPLHVESVAWIAERKDLLCALFMLLALLAYACFAELSKVKSPKSKVFYSTAVFLFALALMSKPMAVTLPFLLLLLDVWPLKRIANCELRIANLSKNLLIEKIPFFALSLAASVVTFAVQKGGNAVESLNTFSMSVRIENAFVSYFRYLAKTLWPATLANPYPHPGHWPNALVIGSAALFAVLCVLAILGARKFPFIFTGWFWFAGMLVPVIGLVQVGTQAMADRYAYMPIIGVFVIFVWGIAQILARQKFPKIIPAVLALILLAASAAKTREQLSFWKNDFTLFSHALTVTENNATASVNLGNWLAKNNQPQAALEHLSAALRMRPDDPLVLYDAGNALVSLGNYDEAIRNYRRALEFAPGRPNILNNLGCALLAQDQLTEAVTNLQAALQVKPDFAYAHNALATAFFKQGNFTASAEHFSTALKLEPTNAQFAANLGDALVRLGKIQEAAEYYRQATALAPDNPEFQQKLNSLAAPAK